MTDTVIYLSDYFRVIQKTSKKGNVYKCLQVAIDGETNWQFVCFLK